MPALALSEAQAPSGAFPAGKEREAPSAPAPVAPWPAWRVHPEFLGHARTLVAKFKQQDAPLRDHLQRTFAPLKQRMSDGHSPRQRVQDLAAAARNLEQLPTYGLLTHTRDFSLSRRTLDDWRLSVASGSFTKVSWTAPHLEPALLVVMITMKVITGKAALNCDVLIIIGMHALARWFQRSLNVSEAALLADLRDLALHYDVLLPDSSTPPHRWRCQTSNGVWVGESVRYEHRIMLTANSFHGADFNSRN